jgi:mono/diheme cytochrome c family protein
MKNPIVTLFALAFANTVFAQSPGTVGDVERGRKLYHAHGCYGCHGLNGETGARDLVATNSPFIASEAVFNAFLRMRADQAPLLPSTRMPNYAVEALSNKEVSDIYAFVRTFKLDAPTPATVPTLRAILKSAEKPYKP